MEIASSSAEGLATVRMACQVAKGLSTHCVEVKFHVFLISVPNERGGFHNGLGTAGKRKIFENYCIPDLSVVFCSPGFSETSAYVRYITGLKK